jgi:sugar phosphate isomerase/epimerase
MESYVKKAIVLSTHAAKFDAVAFKGDLEANLVKVGQLGYDGVELAIRDPKLVDGNGVMELARRHRLDIVAIGTGQAWGEEGLSFSDPDPDVRRAAIERAKSHVPFASQTGATIIIGLLRGTLKPGVERAQAMPWIVEALRECADAAAAAGVKIVVEPINRYETTLVNTVEEGLALIEEVGASNVGLLLDTFHMNIEEADIAASIRKAGERLLHFHVADSNRWYPGGGHLDFAAVVAALQDIGYGGYVSAEAMPMPDADTCAQKSIEAMRSWGL